MMWIRRNRISDEHLDWAIRTALRAETEGREPSPQVWERIRARITNPRPEQEPRPRRVIWQARLASVLQGAVLAVLVLGFGLGITRGFPTPEWSRPTVPTEVVASSAKSANRYPKDVLNAKRLMQLDAPRFQPGAWRWPQY